MDLPWFAIDIQFIIILYYLFLANFFKMRQAPYFLFLTNPFFINFVSYFYIKIVNWPVL